MQDDDLLKQNQAAEGKTSSTEGRLEQDQLRRLVNNIKKDLMNMEERIANACYEIEQLGQYFRRECLEISGIKDEPLFTVLQCCCCTSLPGVSVRNTFSSIQRKLSNKKATNLPDLDLNLKDLLQDIIESPEKNDDLQGSSYEKYS